ncbi:MAG TPA: autotransporter [Thermoanaerobaculia bacterium]|nr:autotransporter [Thermoanaerobaculia bacterium]
MRRNGRGVALAVFILAFAMSAFGQQPAASPPPAAHPDPWPKTATAGGTTYTLYQPQVDSWDYALIRVHAAISVLPPGVKEPVFGVVEVAASTQVDRLARTVHFSNITITKATFPSAPTQTAPWQAAIQSIVSKGPAPVPLDRLEAALKVLGAEKKARAIPVKNQAPKFVFAQNPTVLVIIDGDPVWTAVQGTSLQRVLNSRSLIVRDAAGNFYIHVLDGFEQASSLSGPWAMAVYVPEGLDQAAQSLAKQNVVDLMRGQPDEKTGQYPLLMNGAPALAVATTPTELVVTQGAPDWTPVEGTKLLYVKNTTGNVFKNLVDQQTYVLVTGRWFRAVDFGGPWEYVKGMDLPIDFAMIPDDSPKENVKASVPGMAQAQEAMIASEIPQTATVDRLKAKYTAEISGTPQLVLIEGTSLYYVANSPAPIIKVTDQDWYACQNGVWFAASSLAGPWAVAAAIPPVIYSIPPSSPVYYVTYVTVYNATPTTVLVGYTPGYMGTFVSADGVVVYGTGYDYAPYIDAAVWYPPPVTYGYAANVTFTPWTGWAVGFGFGLAMGAAVSGGYYGACWGAAPYWGAMPYAYHGAAYGVYGGAVAWGPGGWAATSGNVYHQYGATSGVTRSSAGYNAWTGNAWSSNVGASYNSTTGRVSAGQTATVSNAYTGGYASGSRAATYNPTTGVSAEGGRATVGNAYTGQQATVGHAEVSGAGGQTAHVQQVNGNTWAEKDGSVYKNTGSGWQQNSGSGWSSANDAARTQSYQSHDQAYQSGSQRSAAASSWGGRGGGGEGGRSWGGGGGFGGFRGGRR